MSACCTARTAARIESRSAARTESLLAASPRRACTWSSTFRTSPFRAQPATSPSAKTSELRPAEIVAATDDLELIAPVLRPGGFVMSVHERLLLAPGLRLDATRVDPVAHEVLLRRLGAAVAERQVVLVRAALVAVAADADLELRVRLQNGDLLVEGPGVLRADVRLVVVEVDHGGDHALDFIAGAAQRGQRIGIGHRCDCCRRLLAAGAGHEGGAHADHEEQRYRFHLLSPIRGWKR